MVRLKLQFDLKSHRHEILTVDSGISAEHHILIFALSKDPEPKDKKVLEFWRRRFLSSGEMHQSVLDFFKQQKE